MSCSEQAAEGAGGSEDEGRLEAEFPEVEGCYLDGSIVTVETELDAFVELLLRVVGRVHIGVLLQRVGVG